MNHGLLKYDTEMEKIYVKSVPKYMSSHYIIFSIICILNMLSKYSGVKVE